MVCVCVCVCVCACVCICATTANQARTGDLSQTDPHQHPSATIADNRKFSVGSSHTTVSTYVCLYVVQVLICYQFLCFIQKGWGRPSTIDPDTNQAHARQSSFAAASSLSSPSSARQHGATRQREPASIETTEGESGRVLLPTARPKILAVCTLQK
jgi:hypothetical protein